VYHLAKKHFKKADPLLHEASLGFEIEDLKQSDNLFKDITWTIIGQQLSGKAADTIFGRFKELFPKGIITPEKIIELEDIKIRSSGLSGAKMRAVRDLSEKIISKELDLKQIPLLPDVEVIIELTKVKGIGPWTAEMILMFSLGRTDIFSQGDLVLKKELMNLYGWKKLPSEKKILETIQKWSPYRTYASRILWRIADSRKK
jgi:DNA-3-methyladenine glycosylase II